MESIAWCFESFTLLSDQRLLMSEGVPVRLGGRALDILIALVEFAGQFIGRDELIARVWGERVVEEINLRVQVAALRRVLGDDERGDPRFILNLPTKGYCFVAPVTTARRVGVVKSSANMAAGGLPTSLATLVGREAIVAELGEELRSRGFITIVGPGGIGKSAVAVKVAATAASLYPHGVYHVDLGGLADDDIACSRIVQAMGGPGGLPNATEWIFEALHARKILLVLDGCEGVINLVAELAEELLATAPHAHLLVTSREPLRIPGEQVHRLTPLAVPPPDADPSLQSPFSFSSVQLFSDRACTYSGNFEPSAVDARLMMEISRRLDGMPLAIELAAHRAEHLGLQGILEQLDEGFDVLEDERRKDVARQQSLRSSFNWSFAGLTPDEQRILCRLSVFAGKFSLASGAHLASDGGDEVAVSELIGQLATKSLVSVEPGEGGTHYRLLGATREYARTRLRAQGDHSDVARKHAQLTIKLLEAADADRARRTSQAWLMRYAFCLGEVRAALDWLSTQSNESSLQMRLLAASLQLWFQLSSVAEYCDRADAVLGQLPSLYGDPDLVRVKAAVAHARLHVSGADDDSLAAFQEAIAMAESLGDHGDHLMALLGLWLGHYLSGRYPEALAVARESEVIAARAPAKAGFSSDRMLLVSLKKMGRHAEARVRGERALASILLMPVSGTGTRPQLEQEAVTKIHLARVLWIQGLPDSSLALARDAVHMARASLHDLTKCLCLHGLVVIALWTGQRDEASNAMLELSALATKHRLGFWAAWGRFDRDMIAFVDGGSMRPDWREPMCGVRQLELMATFNADLLQPEIVLRAEAGLAPWCEPDVLRARGCQAMKMATAEGGHQALALFGSALELARAHGALSWELRAANSIAAVSHSPEDASRAIEMLASTLSKFTEGFSTPDLRRAEQLLKRLRSQ